MVGGRRRLVDRNSDRVRRGILRANAASGGVMAIFIDKITTGFELPGHRVVENCGIARGIIVRSRSILGSMGAALQTLFGGNITLYTQLCERARDDAFQLMLDQAREMGGNAVIGVRYDATEVGAGITEVLAYGTAVRVEPIG
jgi:uncharacterized protein YbjQ (UPF0145 family)